MTQDLSINTAEGKLNIRVAAWIRSEDKLLVSQFPDGTLSLPGGRVTFNESSTEAIKRELFEETGEELTNEKLVGIIENFFRQKMPYHELLFIYTGELSVKEQYAGSDSEDQQILWLDYDKLSLLKPFALTELAEQLASAPDDHVVHLINRD